MGQKDPSIHISYAQFLSLTKELGIKVSKPKAQLLFQKARQYSLDHRSIVVSNRKKLTETIEKRTQATIGDTNLLAQTIYAVRVKKKHIGVTKIKQFDSAWATLKELTNMVNEFCQAYDLPTKAGFVKFVETGFNLMETNKYKNYNTAPNWLKKNYNMVVNRYEADEALSHDSDPKSTTEFYNAFNRRVMEMSGIYDNYTSNPYHYVNFLKGRELADSLGVDYEIFLDAQFAALAFCHGIPHLEDLHNEKARQRLSQYLSKNGGLQQNTISRRMKQPDKSVWDDFKK